MFGVPPELRKVKANEMVNELMDAVTSRLL